MTQHPPAAGSHGQDDDPRIERRRLLILGSASAAALLVACGGGGDEDETGQPVGGAFPAGQVSDFPEGSVTRIDEGGFLVLHDAGGLYAMTAICTHQACTLDVAQDSLPCPCHASVFDLEGSVVTGPASVPLDHLQLTVEPDGTVVVDSSVTVPVGTRTQG